MLREKCDGSMFKEMVIIDLLLTPEDYANTYLNLLEKGLFQDNPTVIFCGPI